MLLCLKERPFSRRNRRTLANERKVYSICVSVDIWSSSYQKAPNFTNIVNEINKYKTKKPALQFEILKD